MYETRNETMPGRDWPFSALPQEVPGERPRRISLALNLARPLVRGIDVPLARRRLQTNHAASSRRPVSDYVERRHHAE